MTSRPHESSEKASNVASAGLRRDPPDALVEQYLPGLDAPGAFAVELAPGSAPKASPPNPADRDQIWKALQVEGMRQDFSWDRSAREYVKLYENVVRRRRGIRG